MSTSLPWNDWADYLNYPDSATMLQTLWNERKSIGRIAKMMGTDFRSVERQLQKDNIDYCKRPPGGPNHTGPDYPVIRWAMECIPRKKLEKMTIRDIIDMSWEEPSKRLICGLQCRLMYHKIKFKAGVRGRPIKHKGR